ncbi:MAG: DUF2089 domain-containing protein [Peptococcaceae bacterium]|nr:DUF2089 domain-containing protein [Peptococcaceae bacterium]
MRKQAPGLCPVCGEKFHVAKLDCHRCKSSLSGDFEPCRFCALTNEHKSFLEVFIKSRGNIKDVERELGISYPTVRSRLDNVLVALGFRVDATDERADLPQKRKDILESLSRGELSADEAVKLLRSLS